MLTFCFQGLAGHTCVSISAGSHTSHMCLKKVSAVDRVVVSDPGFPKVSPIDKGRSIYSICSASPLTREWSRSTVSQAVQLLLWQKGNELRWIEAHHQTKTRYFFKIKILSTISYWPSKTKKNNPAKVYNRLHRCLEPTMRLAPAFIPRLDPQSFL